MGEKLEEEKNSLLLQMEEGRKAEEEASLSSLSKCRQLENKLEVGEERVEKGRLGEGGLEG